MAHTSDECLQVGVASFTYLEVGLMVAMALCFVLIGMLWRYGAKMERRAKKRSVIGMCANNGIKHKSINRKKCPRQRRRNRKN